MLWRSSLPIGKLHAHQGLPAWVGQPGAGWLAHGQVEWSRGAAAL